MIKKKNIQQAISFIRSVADFKPKLALVLGSGLGDFSDNITTSFSVLASDIPHYPVSSVPGHAGKLIFGYLKSDVSKSVPLLVFQGRIHFYEFGSLDHVVFPLMVASQLGVKKLIITNAAGGLNSLFAVGDLMLIRDVLDLAFLRHSSTKEKSRHLAYSPKSYFDAGMQRLVLECASQLGVKMQQGTYCWLKGPSYETPAEIQMLKRIGVDAVGMSTVPEIYTAFNLGMKIVGISLISNLAAGISLTKLSHSEVTETANSIKEQFANLIVKLIFSLK